jgi:hypothetical protein
MSHPALSEHAEQAAFIDWVHRLEPRIPELGTLYAVINGAALAKTKVERSDGSTRWSRGGKQARKLNAEGMRKGMPDTHLPARGKAAYHWAIGLWLEFKRPGEHPTEAQLLMAERLRAQDHIVFVVTTAEEAIDRVEEYLDVPPHERTQHFR